MTDLSDALAAALSVISSFEGVTLEYRAGESGSWSTLTGFCLHKDRLPQMQYDEQGNVYVTAHTANLKGPLTPPLAAGYQVRAGSADTDIWSVQSAMFDSQQVCLCRRTPVKTLAGPDRGTVR